MSDSMALSDDIAELEMSIRSREVALDKELLRKSVALDSVYEQAAFEIRLGRLDGKFAVP